MQPNINAPEFRADFAQLADYYTRFFGQPAQVYYPGCGIDATPGVAFFKSSVHFVDPEQFALDRIKLMLPFARTMCAKAEDISSDDKYDLVIDCHSHAPFEHEVKDLKSGGHLIILNKMSDSAFDHPDFALVAAFHVEDEIIGTTTYRLVLHDLEKYYEELEPEIAAQNPFSNKRKVRARYYIFRKK